MLRPSYAGFWVIRPDQAARFLLIGNPKRAAEFNDIVRHATDEAGEDYVAFPISDGGHGYSQMFILPLDDMPPS